MARNPEDILNGNRLALAQNLQLALQSIKEAVKSVKEAKDGRVWISRKALEGLKRVLPG